MWFWLTVSKWTYLPNIHRVVCPGEKAPWSQGYSLYWVVWTPAKWWQRDDSSESKSSSWAMRKSTSWNFIKWSVNRIFNHWLTLNSENWYVIGGLTDRCWRAHTNHFSYIYLVKFPAIRIQAGLVECDQPGQNHLIYSAMAGNWTRAT